MIPGVPPHIKGRLGGVALDDHDLTMGGQVGLHLTALTIKRGS